MSILKFKIKQRNINYYSNQLIIIDNVVSLKK